MDDETILDLVSRAVIANRSLAGRILGRLVEHANHGEALMFAASVTSQHMESMRKRVDDKDAALRSALALLDTKRLSEDVKHMLNVNVLRGIEGDSMCDLERRAVERVTQNHTS